VPYNLYKYKYYGDIGNFASLGMIVKAT
jgi:hypothetical protein